MSPNIELNVAGEIGIPHGRLLLPQRLVVNDDLEVPVEWETWDGTSAAGKAGQILLNATVDSDAGLHLGLEILNDGEAPTELREAAWQLLIDQPDRIAVHPDCGIETVRPWDFNLTHDTLTHRGREERCLALTFGNDTWYVGSEDPMRFADGHLRAEPDAPGEAVLRISWHRVEPAWQYNGMVATRPLNGLWIYEGQTRFASINMADNPAKLARPVDPAPKTPANLPLCVLPKKRTYDRGPIMDAIKRLRMERGEYADLFAGGYDHRNQRIVEPHVSRAEYGEFLLHEYMRTGEPQLWDWVTRFAERFVQVSVNRSSHPERGGAVRGRYGDNNIAHPIRSMRGSVFFWEMAELTGRESYRRTSLGIADFLTRSFPWTNARQAAAARDLVYMHKVSGDPRYLETARSIIDVLREVEQPGGGWFEYWNEKGEAYAYDPPTHHGGEWTPISTIKPEMLTYNVNGLLDAVQLDPDALPGALDMIRHAAEWLVETQDASGAWPFPRKESPTRFGYALMLDAAAMLKAGKAFGEERFVDSGRRAIDYGLAQIEERGYVPAISGLPDADQVESSLTCFYALEAFATAESL